MDTLEPPFNLLFALENITKDFIIEDDRILFDIFESNSWVWLEEFQAEVTRST